METAAPLGAEDLQVYSHQPGDINGWMAGSLAVTGSSFSVGKTSSFMVHLPLFSVFAVNFVKTAESKYQYIFRADRLENWTTSVKNFYLEDSQHLNVKAQLF